MKYVRIEHDGKISWGVLCGDTVETLSAPPFEGICYDGSKADLKSCRLLAPTTPTKIVCIGQNYYDHTVEMGESVPESPVIFLKTPNAFNEPEGKIHAPAFVKRLDYEGELGVVIKRRAKNVKAEDFEKYVLGYLCFNDVTARDIQRADGQWSRGKSMDGFAPMGPWVTDEVDPTDLAIKTRLNGIEVQSSRTSFLMNKLPDIFEFITESITLEPGDVIATGTPAGVGPMKPGDIVEVEIEGIGVLRNHVV